MNSISNTESAKNIGYNNTTSGLTATDVQGAIDEVNSSFTGSVKPEGFITFKEKLISAVPVIIPVYHTESNYAFITVTTSNFNTHTGIFCIRLNKSDGSFLVYAKINNDNWISFSNYEANWLAL